MNETVKSKDKPEHWSFQWWCPVQHTRSGRDISADD